MEFPAAVGGRSLRHTLTSEGVKEELVVADRASAGVPGAESYSLVFTLPDGVTARAAGAAGVEFVDASGQVLAGYGGGYAYDSASPEVGQGATSGITVALAATTAGTATVTVGVDRAWLTAPERTFPVVIDPAYRLTVNTNSSGSDTWVQSNISTTSQWNDPELKTGTYDGTTAARSFLNFTTSSIPTGVLVTGATLSVNNIHSYSCSARTVDAYAVVGSAATSSTVWGNQPGVEKTIDGHASFAHGRAECPTAWAPIPVGEIAQHWVSNPSLNYGLRLSASETDVFAWKRYSSGDSGAATAPVLTVDYNTDCTVYTGPAGAKSVCGAIRDRYVALGEANGVLGPPVTDELSTPDGAGRYNHFSNNGGTAGTGSIYWTPKTGAHDVYGAIRVRWSALGWEKSYLGYPTTGETGVPGGRRNGFQQGAILWDRTSGTTLPTAGAGYDAGSPGYFTTTDIPVTDQVSASVNVATGNLQVSTGGLSAPGVGEDRRVGAVYNSAIADFLGRVGSGGYGWRFSDTPDLRLRGMSDGSQILTTASQHADVYLRNGDGTYTPPPGAQLTQLVKQTSGEHTLTYLNTGRVLTFRTDGQLVRDADRNGNTPTITYPTGSLSPSGITGSRGTGNPITFTYGASGTVLAGRVTSLAQTYEAPTPTSASATLTRTLTYGYSTDGLLLEKITDGEGRVTQFGYTGRDLTSITSPRGTITSFTYDTGHRVTRIVRDSATGGIAATTGLNYNAGASTDSTGATAATDANGGITTYTRDAFGRVLKVTDPNGNPRNTEFDANNNVTAAVDALGARTTFGYNGNGSPDSVTLPKTASTTTAATAKATYADPAHQFLPDTATDPQANTTTLGYDTPGNLETTSTPANGGTVSTTNTYNPPAGQTPVCVGGGKPGQLCDSTDGRNNKTVLEYDTGGDLKRVVPPTGAVKPSSFTYDGAGRVKTVLDGNAKTTTYVYDKLDRVLEVRYNNTTSCPTPAGADCIRYTYDGTTGDGNLTSRDDASGTTSYGYDRLNRQTSQSGPPTPAASPSATTSSATSPSTPTPAVTSSTATTRPAGCSASPSPAAPALTPTAPSTAPPTSPRQREVHRLRLQRATTSAPPPSTPAARKSPPSRTRPAGPRPSPPPSPTAPPSSSTSPTATPPAPRTGPSSRPAPTSSPRSSPPTGTTG